MRVAAKCGDLLSEFRVLPSARSADVTNLGLSSQYRLGCTGLKF
jgi:hypothetical protein